MSTARTCPRRTCTKPSDFVGSGCSRAWATSSGAGPTASSCSARSAPAPPNRRALDAGGAPLTVARLMPSQRRSRHWSGAPPADLLLHHVGVEAHAAVGFDLAVDALDLDVEAREEVGALFEGQQVVENRPSPLVQPLARHDARNARRIDHEKGGGDATGRLVDAYVV